MRPHFNISAYGALLDERFSCIMKTPKGGIMKLTLDQKLISIGGKTAVVDERGVQWFFAKGKIFTFNPNYHIYDLSGNTVYYFKRRYFRLFGKFDIYNGADEKVGQMKGRPHWPFTRRFRMTTDKGRFYVLEGKWNSKVYAVEGNEGWKLDKKVPVLVMHKNFFHIRDRFFVDFDPNRIDPAIATIVGLVNDMIFHNG